MHIVVDYDGRRMENWWRYTFASRLAPNKRNIFLFFLFFLFSSYSNEFKSQVKLNEIISTNTIVPIVTKMCSLVNVISS